MYLVVYRKPSYDLVYRYVKYNALKVGDKMTSSSYLLIAKGIFYNNKIISEKQYNEILEYQSLKFNKIYFMKISLKKILDLTLKTLLSIFLVKVVIIDFVIYIVNLF